MFIIYRDGFMLLVMGYTGKKALQIKLMFIAAFNAMEAELAGKAEQVALPEASAPSTAADRAPLRALVHAWATTSGLSHQTLWPQVRAHFQLSRIDDLPVEWLPDALAFVQGKIDGLPKALPEPPQEEDASVFFRQVREDLQLVLKILDVHSVADFRLLQSGRMSQLHIMKQCNTHVRRAQSGINTALAELKEANRFARMLADNSGTGSHVVPLVKIDG